MRVIDGRWIVLGKYNVLGANLLDRHINQFRPLLTKPRRSKISKEHNYKFNQ